MKWHNIQREQAEKEAEEGPGGKKLQPKDKEAEEPQEEEEEDEEAEGGAHDEPQFNKTNKNLDAIFDPHAAEGGDDLNEPVDSQEAEN